MADTDSAAVLKRRMVGCACRLAHAARQRPAVLGVQRLDVVTRSCALGGMHNPPSDDRTASSILDHAISIAELARPLLAIIQRKDRDLASQIRRAISSIGLNAAEAQGNSGGNARVRFESALGSLYEARTGLLLAIGWRYISNTSAQAALSSLNSLGGRLYGLAHPERIRR